MPGRIGGSGVGAGADLERLAERFAAVAASIRERRADATVAEAIGRAESLAREICQTAAAAEARTLSGNLRTALEAWRTVWPRMRAQPEFRAAVGREAALWAKRLRSAGPGDHPPIG